MKLELITKLMRIMCIFVFFIKKKEEKKDYIRTNDLMNTNPLLYHYIMEVICATLPLLMYYTARKIWIQKL